MKKALSVIFTVLCINYSFPAFSVSDMIYVDPGVAKVVLEKHFSNLSYNLQNVFYQEIDDEQNLLNVVDEYNNMLAKNHGLVSIEGLVNVCSTAFKGFKLNKNFAQTHSEREISDIYENLFFSICSDFANDLVKTEFLETGLTDGCPYKISKFNNSQMKIKYTLPDNTGFIRNGGSIAWRLFNPGNLRGSSLACGTIKTKPNGAFAVFASEEIGKQALHQLLSTDPVYMGKTIKQAIYKYAPPKDGNNTEKYVRDLQRAGININKKLPNLTDAEFEKLEKTIMQLEGWGKRGTETKF